MSSPSPPMSDPNAHLRALLEDWSPAPIPMGAVGCNPTAGSPPPEAEQQSRAGEAGPVGTARRAALDGCGSVGHPQWTSAPDEATEPRRGDVVSWLHHDRPQLGVVPNIGADGRIWVRLLDRLDQRVPVDHPDALFIHHTAQALRADATDFWLSVLEVDQ